MVWPPVPIDPPRGHAHPPMTGQEAWGVICRVPQVSTVGLAAFGPVVVWLTCAPYRELCAIIEALLAVAAPGRTVEYRV